MRKFIFGSVLFYIVIMVAYFVSDKTEIQQTPQETPVLPKYILNARDIQEQEIAGLRGNDPIIVKKHLDIIRNYKEVPNQQYAPAHIMCLEGDYWRLAGTASIIRGYSNNFVTAHHIFSGRTGRYGIRKLSTQILSGHEKIYPIVRVISPENLSADDSITGFFGEFGTPSADITVPNKYDEYNDLEKPGTYTFTEYRTNVKFLTYPDREIKTFIKVDNHLGKTMIYMELHDFVPGESGTGGIISTETQDHLVLITQTNFLPGEVAERFMKDPTIRYAAGHMISIK